jgi:hypothetical protein
MSRCAPDVVIVVDTFVGMVNAVARPARQRRNAVARAARDRRNAVDVIRLRDR